MCRRKYFFFVLFYEGKPWPCKHTLLLCKSVEQKITIETKWGEDVKNGDDEVMRKLEDFIRINHVQMNFSEAFIIVLVVSSLKNQVNNWSIISIKSSKNYQLKIISPFSDGNMF